MVFFFIKIILSAAICSMRKSTSSDPFAWQLDHAYQKCWNTDVNFKRFFVVVFYCLNNIVTCLVILLSYKYQPLRSWIIRIHHVCEGGIEKSVPRITDWHQVASWVMTTGDRKGRVFLSRPHTNNGFVFCLPLNTSSYIGKKREKGFQEILNTLRCDMVTKFLHFDDVTDRRLPSLLLLYLLDSQYCERYGPRSDCSLGIRVHSVFFHDTIWCEVHMNIV